MDVDVVVAVVVLNDVTVVVNVVKGWLVIVTVVDVEVINPTLFVVDSVVLLFLSSSNLF